MKNGKKYCPQCKLTKLVTDFNKDCSVVDGLKCYCKQCRKNNYLKKQEYNCNRSKNYSQNNKMMAFKIISGGENISCVKHHEWNCCGNNIDIDFLSFDHINGDGAEHRRKIGATASSSLHRWIINNQEEAKKRIQILCMNAQVKKKRTNGEQKYARRTV